MERFREGYESIDEKYRSPLIKLLYARILFNKGETLSAIELAENILKCSRRDKIKLTLVQASLSKINMIFDHSGKKHDILNLFRKALFYSCEDRILLPFQLESEIVAKVINQYEPEFYNDLNFAEKAHYKDIRNICKIEAAKSLGIL